MSHSCRTVPLYPLVVLLFISLTTQAQSAAPFSQPRVNLAYADSLKGLLRQRTPDTSQVNQLILLSEYYLSRHREIGDKEYLEDTYCYYRQAAGLSDSLRFVSGQIRCQYLLSSIISRQERSDQEVKDVIAEGTRLSQKAGDKLLESARATKDTLDPGRYYLRIGSCFKNLKQRKEGLRYLHQSIQFSRQAGHPRYAYFAAGQVADTLTAQHQEQEALLFMRKVIEETPPADEQYKVINDSIFNETKSKQVAGLQIEYETKES